MTPPTVIPELYVVDFNKSLDFYSRLARFKILYTCSMSSRSTTNLKELETLMDT